MKKYVDFVGQSSNLSRRESQIGRVKYENVGLTSKYYHIHRRMLLWTPRPAKLVWTLDDTWHVGREMHKVNTHKTGPSWRESTPWTNTNRERPRQLTFSAFSRQSTRGRLKNHRCKVPNILQANRKSSGLWALNPQPITLVPGVRYGWATKPKQGDIKGRKLDIFQVLR